MNEIAALRNEIRDLGVQDFEIAQYFEGIAYYKCMHLNNNHFPEDQVKLPDGYMPITTFRKRYASLKETIQMWKDKIKNVQPKDEENEYCKNTFIQKLACSTHYLYMLLEKKRPMDPIDFYSKLTPKVENLIELMEKQCLNDK